MSGFNFFRDGGDRLLDGINSNPFQAGIDENRARQDAEIARQQKAYEHEQSKQYRSAMAEAMRSGDASRMALTAASYGDKDTATALNAYRTGDLDQSKFQREAQSQARAGMLSVPYEQRRAAVDANRALYKSLGFTDDQLNADLTDEVLRAGITDYSMKDRDAHDVAVFNANTGRYEADTKREELNQPKIMAPGSTALYPDGRTYRSPSEFSANPEYNVYSVGNPEGGEAPPVAGGPYSPDGLWNSMIQTESGGRQLDRNGRPLTSSAGAIGIAQVMPATGREVAKSLGIAWDENRYRTDPEYNARLGRAYYDQMQQRFGGDQVKAVAAYNAGPGGVDRAVARAARTGGDWTQYLPAETQGYIRKVFGGAQRSPAAQAGPRQVQQGQGPRMIQQGVPKPPKDGARGGGKPVPQKWAETFMSDRNIYLGFDRAIESFRPGFGGNPVGRAENFAQGIAGDRVGTPGQRDWWANHFGNDNIERHKIFGAALTSTERSAWDATTITPSMSDEQILRNLRRRREIVANKLRHQRKFLLAQGYSPEAVRVLTEGL